MTIYDLNAAPSLIDVQLLGNTALGPSGLIGSAQTTDRQGLKWAMRYTFSGIRTNVRAELLGTLAALRGQSNRLRVPVHDNPARGAYGGTPLVAGASQTGNTLNIDGCSATVTNWIRKGDYFSVIVNGEPELKMATLDASSDGAGAATLTFEPKLRAAPADNAVIYVEDGVLTVPSGIFLLEGSAVGWSSTPWTDGALSDITLSMIEDVFATQ